MKNKLVLTILIISMFFTLGNQAGCDSNTQDIKDVKAVQRQQEQYSASQPLPAFNWSLERHLVIQLYSIRNVKAATHSVWRSDYGAVEGDCPSIGFGIPYDTSLTNPLKSTDKDDSGSRNNALTSIEMQEPNGLYSSKNTSATWVLCASKSGSVEPVYVETKVTVYPYLVKVDYDKNRVTKAGKSSIYLKTGK